jgi:hypothetical protein
MLASGLPASSTLASASSSPGKVLLSTDQGPTPLPGGKCAKEGSSPRRSEGRRTREDSFPRWEEGVNEKAWESCTDVKIARHMASISHGEILCPLPGTCMEDVQR